MRKYLVILGLMFMMLFGSIQMAFADEVKPEPTIKQEIFSRLDAIAAKLGTAATHLWEVLTRQAYVEGITDIVVFVILVVAIICYFNFLGFCTKHRQDKEKHWVKDGTYNDSLSDIAGSICIIGGIFSTIGTVLSVVFLVMGIQHLFNPEFYALQYILETLGK